jgi:endonuclease-3
VAAALASVLDSLEALYGPPRPHEPRDPFELVLWENVAYLTTDERRRAAFDALRRRVGTTPEAILAAPSERLREVAHAGGILPDRCVSKLQSAAQTALTRFGGDLRLLLEGPTPIALRGLRRFPGIGEPGAEKILLFSRRAPLFALESNGLRALLRLGFGEEKKSYAGSYASVRDATRSQIREDCEWLIRAHHLLRRHGQELCRRVAPRCDVCPVAATCMYLRRNPGRPS